MSFEIHMYMAVAKAESTERYPEGERHPLLVLLRQPVDSEHDLSAAESVAMKDGWTEVDFTKAGTLPPDAEANMDEPFHSRYREAVEHGEAMLVYDTVVKVAPRK